MKSIIILFILFNASFIGRSQNKINTGHSFADTVKKYFPYNELGRISCNLIPTGIYGLAFDVDNKGIPYNFQSSSDSLVRLDTLLIDAIKVSTQKVHLKKGENKYLQLFFINILLGCNSTYDSTKPNSNLYSDLAKILDRQLSGIEDSFKEIISDAGNYSVLETVIIDDNNPNLKFRKIGFQNDTKESPEDKNNLELIQKIQKLKDSKQEK